MAVQSAEWVEVIDDYHWFVENDGERHRPILDFACWLAGGEYGQVLYPSTSHEALGLSTASTYLERLQRPMVYVEYAEEPGQFVVHWQRGQGKTVREEIVSSLQAPEVFGRILAWLEVSTEHRRTRANHESSPGPAA